MGGGYHGASVGTRSSRRKRRRDPESDFLDEIRDMESRAFNGHYKILNPFNIGVNDGLKPRRARRG